MASNYPSSAPSATPYLTRSRTVMVAIAASAIQMLMLVPGYSEDGSFQVGEWLIVLAISSRSASRSSCSLFRRLASR